MTKYHIIIYGYEMGGVIRGISVSWDPEINSG